MYYNKSNRFAEGDSSVVFTEKQWSEEESALRQRDTGKFKYSNPGYEDASSSHAKNVKRGVELLNVLKGQGKITDCKFCGMSNPDHFGAACPEKRVRAKCKHCNLIHNHAESKCTSRIRIPTLNHPKMGGELNAKERRNQKRLEARAAIDETLFVTPIPVVTDLFKMDLMFSALPRFEKRQEKELGLGKATLEETLRQRNSMIYHFCNQLELEKSMKKKVAKVGPARKISVVRNTAVGKAERSTKGKAHLHKLKTNVSKSGVDSKPTKSSSGDGKPTKSGEDSKIIATSIADAKANNSGLKKPRSTISNPSISINNEQLQQSNSSSKGRKPVRKTD